MPPFLLVLLLGAGLLLAPAARAQLPAGCPSELESEIAERINAERTSHGLAPLEVDVRLVDAARRHSEDMATRDFFSHTGSDGSRFSERIDVAGYDWRAAGETIAAGYRTASAVVAGWMGSPPHRAILLSSAYRHVGVGVASAAGSAYGIYSTADFGDTAGAVQRADALCGLPACRNGIDDDGDGLVDFGVDDGCATPDDGFETADCADGIDNDGDGRIDFGPGPANDPGCPLDWGRFVEAPPCSNGLDDDGDGRVDGDDPACAGRAWAMSEREGAPACGLGFELAPFLVWAMRRRRLRAA